jgi:tetratricopeptide (TPR) repeat protein
MLSFLVFLHYYTGYDGNAQALPAITTNSSENNDVQEFIKQGDYNRYTLRDYDKAVEWYDKALASNPNNVDVLSKKGMALSNLYNFTAAHESIDRALAIDPNDADALTAKGWAYHSQRNYTEAIKWYDRALEVNPNDALSVSAKGSLY